MLLLAGLGNPGASYAMNRHNVGFMAVDAIALRHGFSPWRKRFQGECAEGVLGGEKCLLIKPMTFMNNSGRAVSEAARFYKLKADRIIVLHDELDLAPGKVRVKTGGGVAGHNGLRSIGGHLGPDFTRVRIGIGHPGHKDKVHGHVLKDFSRADRVWLEPLLDAIADGAPLLAAGDHGGFMNKVHLAAQPAKGQGRGPDAIDGAIDGASNGTPGKGKAAPRRSSAAERQAAPENRGTPSQRDLARLGARSAPKHKPKAAAKAKKPPPPAPATPEPVADDKDAGKGPFAALKRLLKGRSN